MSIPCRSTLILAFACLISTAVAHDPGLSLATARLGPGNLSIQLAMSRTDVESFVNLDENRDGNVSEAEFLKKLPELHRRAAGAFEVGCGQTRLALGSVRASRDEKDGVHFDLVFQGASGGQFEIRSTWLGELARGHRQVFSFRDGENRLVSEKMLDANHDSITVQLAAPSQPATTTHSSREFLALGLEHIATGYDHLFFIFGLLLAGGGFRSALKIITSFTVAHSITLALATLNLLNLSPRIIEPLIAASIVYVGLENILRKRVENRWMLTFGFGLIHGCGFASALRDLGIGASAAGIAIPLLSFNLGVELGQMAIAAVVLPAIWKCRSCSQFGRRGVPIGSALIALAGGYWFLQRIVL